MSRHDTLDASTRVIDSHAPAIIILLQDRNRIAIIDLNLIRHRGRVIRYHTKRSNGFRRRHWQTLLSRHVDVVAVVGRCRRLGNLGVGVVVVELCCLLQQRCGEVLLLAVTTERHSAESKQEQATDGTEADKDPI